MASFWLAVALLAQAAATLTTVAQGGASGVMDRRELVIRSADAWQSLWKQHSSEPVPKIDFSRTMVVGVFLGTRPTAGYEVTIVTARAEGGVVVVEYRERRPAPGTLAAQVLTSPFHLVRLPQQSGRVEFRQLDGPSAQR